MYLGGLVSAIALAALLSLQPTASMADSIGHATATRNQVNGVVGGQSRTLSSGSSVYSNELVRTGKESAADLRFLDNTNLNVGPTSEVRLDKFVYDPNKSRGNVTLHATKGAMRFVTGEQDKKSYTIKTPYATLGVRGTVVEIVIVRPGKPTSRTRVHRAALR
jgi:hypothetical protein